MKKIYLSLFILAAASSLNAQAPAKTVKPLAKKSAIISMEKAEKSTIVYDKVSIWENDFSVPADWSMTNVSNPPADWTISTDLNASPVSALNPAGFTSGSNGYAIIDSDAQGDGATQDATIMYTGTIDCSGNANVSLTFEQTHRRYMETTTLQVSNDGGATWTDFIVNDGMTVNTNTANPALVQVNISSVAGNQSNVKIAFKYVGTFDWFWAIDDVKIIPTPDFDLQLTSVYWGSIGFWGPRLPYTKVPASQVQPVYFAGITANIGAVNQNDVVFAASATGFNGVSAATPIAAAASDSLETTTQLNLPSTLGTTTVSFGVSSSATDNDMTNNTLPSQAIEVNASVYARDLGTISGGSYNQGNGFEVGNVFDIFAQTETNSITFFPTATANAGAQVYVKLYDLDPITRDFRFVEESPAYTLVAGDLGNAVTLQLNSTITLLKDSTYIAVAGSFGDGGTTNDLVVGTSGVSEDQTTFYYDMTDATWYYTTATPMVRLNLNDNVGIKSVENVSSFSVYPNPANGNVAISYELKNETSVKVQITDLAGKEIFVSNQGNKSGKNSVSVNTAAFANGVYVVNFITNNGVVTEKLVINK